MRLPSTRCPLTPLTVCVRHQGTWPWDSAVRLLRVELEIRFSNIIVTLTSFSFLIFYYRFIFGYPGLSLWRVGFSLWCLGLCSYGHMGLSCTVVGGILISRPGIEPIAPAFGRCTLHHWTTRDVPTFSSSVQFHSLQFSHSVVLDSL